MLFLISFPPPLPCSVHPVFCLSAASYCGLLTAALQYQPERSRPQIPTLDLEQWYQEVMAAGESSQLCPPLPAKPLSARRPMQVILRAAAFSSFLFLPSSIVSVLSMFCLPMKMAFQVQCALLIDLIYQWWSVWACCHSCVLELFKHLHMLYSNLLVCFVSIQSSSSTTHGCHCIALEYKMFNLVESSKMILYYVHCIKLTTRLYYSTHKHSQRVNSKY